MVVQSAMEEVRVCQVAPLPQLPQAPPPAASVSAGGTADTQQDDGEQSDPEVMQVTGEGIGPVNLRHKKQRINGAVQLGVSWGGTTTVSGVESEERERPMSWEGELSEDEDDEDGEDVGRHSPGTTHLGGGVVLIRPGNSPMLVERDDGANSPISLTMAPGGNSKDNGTGDKCVSRVNVPDNKGSNHVIAYVAPVSPAPSTPFGGVTPSVPAFQDRQHGHNSCFGEVSTSSRPSAILGGAFQPPSSAFGESPILTPRPTSSSSSRSSYSPPSQSPLLGRGGPPQGGPPYPHASHQSPLPPRHGAASSDGSVYSPSSSPLQGRHVAVVEGGVYSPSQSPSQGRHRLGDGLSPTAAHLRNLSVSRNAYPPSGDAPVAPYPYLVVQPTPDTRSTASSASVASSASDESNASDLSSPTRRPSVAEGCGGVLADPLGEAGGGAAGVSRQQLLSGPCPVCGDRISGFHYGIFSCESCKGFFKRTVQNKKHYVCLRGANCPVAISTRKKCPACRFDKCLRTGMKLEAIREDRTRGGRSTYQCSYSLPAQLLDSRAASDSSESAQEPIPLLQKESRSLSAGSPHEGGQGTSPQPFGQQPPVVPSLVQEIVSVEHLWHYTDREISRLSEQFGHKVSANNSSVMEVGPDSPGASSSDGGSNLLSSLCNIADHRLYKIVKWCKSLPLFREIQVDDQIALLINSWCELLLLSCCYRSTGTPNEIRVSMGKSVTLGQARHLGMGPVIERMLGLTDLLRRLQVDQREFVCLKVIILLTSDASGLKEPEKVLACKKQVLEALQAYTISHYPTQPSKFGELLLCVPELERACQVSKESLAASRRIASSAHLAASASAAAAASDPQAPSFNLLFELLRGDH